MFDYRRVGWKSVCHVYFHVQRENKKSMRWPHDKGFCVVPFRRQNMITVDNLLVSQLLGQSPWPMLDPCCFFFLMFFLNMSKALQSTDHIVMASMPRSSQADLCGYLKSSSSTMELHGKLLSHHYSRKRWISLVEGKHMNGIVGANVMWFLVYEAYEYVILRNKVLIITTHIWKYYSILYYTYSILVYISIINHSYWSYVHQRCRGFVWGA